MSEVRAPRLLAIAGSPRRGGNSDTLLDACVAGAAAAGADVDRLVVASSGIGPCTGCNECSKDGFCVVLDGMQAVYPRIEAADAFVIATPVFFATVPAVLKAFYDRCQPYWARRFVLHHPIEHRHPAALLVVGGGGDPYGNSCAIAPTRSVLAVLGADYSYELAVEADARGDAAAQEPAIRRAREIGGALALEAYERIRSAGNRA
jgi:multimeric flavodoxin WrbA